MRILIALTLLLISLAITPTAATADSDGPLLMARSHDNFETAMAMLKNSIQEHGYAIAHVQKCDGGMKKFGYNSDYYRVVFFGKADEVERISKASPVMIPYLPLKIVIFAEENRTVLTALNPSNLAAYFPDDATMQNQLGAWEHDLRAILREVDGMN
jgi:uncharacterized protein (DUF302 family)